MSIVRLLLTSIGLALAAAVPAPAAPKAAIFPFELIDTSIEGELGHSRAEEMRRLALVTLELRRLAARDDGYEPVDLSGLAAEIEKAAPFHKCNGCETDIARKIGAEVAITGTVRKVSSLILDLTIYVRDVASGKLTKAMSASIRGNTDESWLRGVRWLIANRLLTEQRPR